MPFIPDYPGERPTLGYLVLEWITEYLATPEKMEYEPLVLTREQAEFILRFYELDPVTGKRKVRRGVLSRPRGWGKSPITAALAAVEGLAPVYPAGWDANGKPVGRPWSDVRKPLVEIAAVSEDQVNRNTWSPLLDVLNGPVLNEYPGTEPMAKFVNLPYGRIYQRTAEARSAKGAPACFVVCDQTESWTPSNGGVELHKTLKNNVVKRGGHMLESPNAYTPGEQSVAESSMASYSLIISGKAKNESGVFYDHREAPPETSLEDRDSLMAGLAIAYGDSADVEHCVIHNPPCENPGWVPLDEIAASIWDPDADAQLSRSDWLNQITHATDSWMDSPTWSGAADAAKVVADRETVVLGFDGSRGRKVKGKPDATALIACRVSDGHVFQINGDSIWEAGSIPNHGKGDPPPNCACWQCWEPDIPTIEAAIDFAFSRYRVVAFYADPGKDWRSHIDAWEKKYARPDHTSILIKSSDAHPFEWWMGGGRAGMVQRAIEQCEGAIRNGDATHDGTYSLTRHVLNARRRLAHGKLALAKENDYSPNKMDGAVATVLAYQARLDALSKVAEETSNFYVPKKLY